MLSFEGDTGPYLQYAHVRLASIERKNPELLPLPQPAAISSRSSTVSLHELSTEINLVIINEHYSIDSPFTGSITIIPRRDRPKDRIVVDFITPNDQPSLRSRFDADKLWRPEAPSVDVVQQFWR